MKNKNTKYVQKRKQSHLEKICCVLWKFGEAANECMLNVENKTFLYSVICTVNRGSKKVSNVARLHLCVFV